VSAGPFSVGSQDGEIAHGAQSPFLGQLKSGFMTCPGNFVRASTGFAMPARQQLGGATPSERWVGQLPYRVRSARTDGSGERPSW